MSFWKSPIQFLKFLITPFTPGELGGLAKLREFKAQGNGYDKVQSTRPQTLGYSLADSPVGMLAWIYEKLVNWTDSYPWTDEEGAYYAGSEHLTIYLYSRFGLTLVSIDLDGYLLVLACRTGGISEDLSRAQLFGFASRGCNCACWRIFLSKGIGSNTSSVGPFPSVLA